MYNPDAKTPIVYYGGKSALIQHILPMIPEHEVYDEPFVGGGAVFFSKRKVPNETINDRLDIVVNFYEQLKKNFAQLKPLVESSLISRSQHRRALAILKRPVSESPVESAWAFWMASNFSFNNKVGGGIKFSTDQNAAVPEQMKNKKKRFTEWLVRRIEDAHIENNDALVVIKSRDTKETFHYIDPPYFNADQGHYKGYTEQDFKNLLDLCEKLKGKFMISNYNSEIFQQYIDRNNWHKKEVDQRLKLVNVKGHRNRNEVIVTNYCPRQINGKQLFNFDI